MPAATVTVRAFASNPTTWSIDFKERRLSVLSAMLLKQWRVPSTFNLLSFLTNSRTCSSELAEYMRSVLYSKFPAQFFSLSPAIQANRVGMTGLATIAEQSLMKVRLFIVRCIGIG